MNAQENRIKAKLLKEAGISLQNALNALWKVYELQTSQDTYMETNALTEIVNIRNAIRLPMICISRYIKHFEKELK